MPDVSREIPILSSCRCLSWAQNQTKTGNSICCSSHKTYPWKVSVTISGDNANEMTHHNQVYRVSKTWDILSQCSQGAAGEPYTIFPLRGLQSRRGHKTTYLRQKRRALGLWKGTMSYGTSRRETVMGSETRKGFRKRIHLRCSLKYKKNFKGRNGVVVRWEQGVLMEGTGEILGTLHGSRWQEP